MILSGNFKNKVGVNFVKSTLFKEFRLKLKWKLKNNLLPVIFFSSFGPKPLSLKRYVKCAAQRRRTFWLQWREGGVFFPFCLLLIDRLTDVSSACYTRHRRPVKRQCHTETATKCTSCSLSRPTY